MRFYFTNLRGAGTEFDPHRCPLQDVQASVIDFLDMREFPEIEDGGLFAWTDNTQTEHDLAILEPDIFYLPIETSGGVEVTLDETVSTISAANRTIILALMEERGIPKDLIIGSTTIREAMRIIIKRIRLMEILRYVDLEIILTGLVGDISTQRKKAMKRRLVNYGFDLTNITDLTTVRDALNDLITQNTTVTNNLPF